MLLWRYFERKWLIVWCLLPFSTVFQLYCCGQCTYPCFPGVLFTSTPHTFLFKPLPAFPNNHCRNNGLLWERWILLQWLSSILRKTIGWARNRSSDPVPKTCMLLTELWGLGFWEKGNSDSLDTRSDSCFAYSDFYQNCPHNHEVHLA